MEELLRDNLSIGGEQSGHVIFPDLLFTGDGLVTALNVLRAMAETGPVARGPGRRTADVPAGAGERARPREA